MSNKFPHKTRKFAARPGLHAQNSSGFSLAVTQTATWFFISFLFLVTALNALHPLDKTFFQLKYAILAQPDSATTHFQLGNYYHELGLPIQARQELNLSHQLALQSGSQTMVLGASTGILDQMENSKQKLEQEISFWQGVANHIAGYRDAYIQLSALSFELNRLKDAKAYIDQAFTIDPNNQVVTKIKEFYKTLPIK